MQRLVFLLIALVLGGAAVVTAANWDKAPPPEHGGETDDRRRDPAIDRLLKTPLKDAEAGHWANSSRGFEAALAEIRKRRGQNSLQAADTISAYGIGLFGAGHKTQALPYMTRAIAAYRAAVGPDSPEVAVALHDYANVVLGIDPDKASPELVAAVRECLRIRQKALGDRNAETAVTYVLLGRVIGMPQVTQGDPAKIEAAADLVRRGISLLPQTPNSDASDLPSARFRLAEVYAHNGLGARTLALVAAADGTDDALDDDQLGLLAKALQTAGDAASAARLRERLAVSAQDNAASTPED